MGGNQFQFYQTCNCTCPYRSCGNWINLAFASNQIFEETYTTLLNQGFRLSGYSIFDPNCKDYFNCIPVQVKVNHFSPSRNQRKNWRKNCDIYIQHHPLGFCEKDFQLYLRYQEKWHLNPAPVSETEYQDFLIASPVKIEMIYFIQEKNFLCISWVDLMFDLMSSVYFNFYPKEASRRLGVFSLLYEIEYFRMVGLNCFYQDYLVK